MGSTDLSIAPNMLQSGSYSAQRLRQMVTSLWPEGVVGLTDLAVSQRGAGANMSVDVAAGDAYILGDAVTRQGMYHVRNDATVNVAVTAADATNPRIDRVVATIKDDAHDASGLNICRIQTVDGTPTVGATLTNLSGAAAIPASSLHLANILVSASPDVTIVTGDISDQRVFVTKGCRIYNSANINIGTSGTAQTLTFDSERFDYDGMHSTSSNTSRITFNTAGVYYFQGNITFALNTTGIRKGIVLLNGGTTIARTAGLATTGLSHDLQVAGVYAFSAGDYIELQAYQNSGGALDVSASLNFTPEFMALRIR